VLAQQLIHSKLGYHHRNDALAHVMAQFIERLNSSRVEDRDRQTRGLDAHRQKVILIIKTELHETDCCGIRHHLSGGERNIVLAAQHAREIHLVEKAQLQEIGAQATSMNDLRLKPFLKLVGAYQSGPHQHVA
jgi:hypothetical protein